MRVQFAADVGHSNKHRQRPARRQLDFAAPLPQFRFNKTQPAGAINILLFPMV